MLRKWRGLGSVSYTHLDVYKRQPLVYVLPIGIGLVFGTMLAPWLERLTKRRRANNEGEE